GNAFLLAAVCVVVGASHYSISLGFAVEAASQDYLSWFVTNFSSNTNVTVALWIMWISLAGVAIVTAWLFIRALTNATRTMTKQVTPTEAATRESATAAH